MLGRCGSANQTAATWVYPTIRAHVEEHKVHTLFAVSVLVDSHYTNGIVVWSFTLSFVGVLVLLRA